MSRNQQNDALEEFFRKGLREETLVEDSTWDLPSDKVWEGIEVRLPDAAPRRRKVIPISKTWLMAAAGVLLFLLAFDSYVAINKINDLQDQMALQFGQLQKLEEGNHTKDNNITSVILQADNHSIEKKMNAFLAKAERPVSINAVDKSNVIIPSFPSPVQPLVLPVRFDQTEEQMFFPSSSHNTIATTTKEDASFTLLPLDVASKYMSEIPVNTIFQSKNTDLPAVLPICAKKRPFYAGIFTAPSHWFNKVARRYNPGESIAEAKVTKQNGQETGFKIGYQLNDKWALESGISYASNTQSIQHQMEMAFHPENEMPGANGLMESNYTSKVNTPYGQADFAMQLSRNPNQILLPGEDLTIALDNDLTTALLQIPLAARYGLQKGKLNVSLSAGVLLSFLQKQELKLTDARVVSHPQILQEQLQLKKVEEPAMDKIHYGVQTGLQVAYQVSPNLDLYVAPTYAHGLSATAEKEEGSTTLAQASVQFGVNVNF
jgi:hypothetical protein